MKQEQLQHQQQQQQSRILDHSNNKANVEAASTVRCNESRKVNGPGCENVPPYRQLKVLLVEDDDSTRHVVAALLRNCGYQVVPASNGLQAWALLTDERSRELDLVLTDVVMPGLSGIGLLSRIMHRESLKKIPVIMMSSHDSTDVVFKCLSKGAADFLVKPVRKNELKNLWQHSWRRRQSSNGIEIETGKLDNACSENETKSLSGSEDLRVAEDQSDDTQSSCTRKSLVELQTPAQQRPNKISSRHNRDSESVEVAGPPVIAQAEEEEQNTSEQQHSPVEAVDLIGNIAREHEVRRINEDLAESDLGGSNSLEVLKDSSSDPTSTSKLELSLRSLSPTEQYVGNGLRQSGGASAFSRYNTVGATLRPQLQQIHQKQCPPQQQQEEQSVTDVNRNSDEAMCSSAGEHLSHHPDQHHQQQEQLQQQQQQQQHMVNFAQQFPAQYAALLAFDQQKIPMGGGTTYYYAQPAVPPWQHAFSPQQRQSPKEVELILEEQQRQFQAFTNILAQHHHYHSQHQRQSAEVTNTSPVGKEAPGCGSTNAADGVSNQFTNGLSGSSHGNGSMSGSNTGLNNCTQQMTTNGDSGSGVNTNSPCSVPVGTPGPEQNRVRREAALNKFRLKRKERCFEKKVRYQSRKRLAEQRPRVRGQFVSQAVFDSSAHIT